MVVIVIIAIIASMLVPAYGGWRARADEARCLANLRSLFVAASRSLDAAGEWPQIPLKMMIDNPKQHARAWVQALEPYGAPHSSWICPTLQRSFQFPMEDLEKAEHYRIDFVPSEFDDGQNSPRLVGHYPWFMEKTASHARGQLIIFADGTTSSMVDFLGQ
jgi:type II secretory pathway pseudopilin PulG